MDSYDDMHHKCAYGDRHFPLARCSNGTQLQVHCPPDSRTIWYMCPCGHHFEKTRMELEVNWQPGELVFDCPQPERMFK